MIRSRRSLENLFLNIALYIGSLFILSAAALLVNSVSAPSLQITLLVLFTGLIYGAGLATYQWVPRLRLASYSFTSTGLALIPFCGIAAYKLIWPFSGASIWLLVSLLGTVAVFCALLLMQAKVMSYLALAFAVSDILAISKTLQVGMIWYFMSLLLLACALELFTRYTRNRLPSQIERGFKDASMIFVPLTMAAALCTFQHMELWELGLIFTAGTIYSLVFLASSTPLFHFIEVRVYSFLAICFFTGIGLTSEHPPLIFKAFYLPALLLLVSSIVLLLIKVPIPRYNQLLDATITYGIAQLLLFGSLANINVAFQLGSFFPEIYRENPPKDGTFFALALTFTLLTFNALALGLLSQTKRLCSFLQLLGAFQTFLMFPTLSWHGVLFGLLCQATVSFSTYRKHSIRKAVVIALPFFLTAAALLLPDVLGILPIFTFYLLGLGCAASYLYSVISHPLADGRLTSHLRLTYHFTTFMGLMLPILCYLALWGNHSIYREHRDTAFFVASCAEAIFMGVVLSSLLAAINRSYYTTTVTIQQQIKTPEKQLSEHYQQFLVANSQQTSSLPPQFISTTITAVKAPILMLSALYISLFALLVSISARYSSPQEITVLFGMALGLLAIFPYSTAARTHAGIAIRGILMWGGLKALLSKNITFESQILLICAVFALLATTSLLIYRFSEGKQKTAEKTVALILSFLCLLTSIALIGQSLSGITWQYLICVLILIALLGVWMIVPREEATVIVQVLLLLQAATLLLIPLSVTSQDTFSPYGVLIIGASISITTKLCAIYLPELMPATISKPPSYLGRWGHQHNRAIALSGTSYASWLFLLTLVNNALDAAILATLLLTLGWALQVKKSQQPIVLIIGMNMVLLRILVDIHFNNSFFYICQAIVMSLSMVMLLGKIPIFANNQKPRKGLFWTAYGIQGVLVLALPSFIETLSTLDRALMVIISGLLLGASSVFKLALQPIVVTALLTYQILYLLGGINVITLFLLGFLLIGIVVWRLLARHDEPESNPAQIKHQPPPQHPLEGDRA